MSGPAVIASHYGDKNLGDVAIAEVVRYALEARGYSPVRLLVLRGEGIDSGSRILDLRVARTWGRLLLGRSRPKLVVVGGGGILQNATSLANLIIHFLAAMAGRLLGARVVLAGIGVGPLNGWLARYLAGWVVRMATGGCLVRDIESKRFCERWSNESVLLAPDLAFAWPLTRNTNLNRDTHRDRDVRKRTSIGSGRILLCLRPPVGSRRKRTHPDQHYLDGLHEIVGTVMRVARENDRPVALLAMHGEQDRLVVERLRDRCSELKQVANIVPCDTAELMGAIAKNDVVVGMRMHSIVFAAMAGAPFVALGYDHKVRKLAEGLGSGAKLVKVEDGWVDPHRLEDALLGALRPGQQIEEARVRGFGTEALGALRGLLGER